ncbi:MAG: hypothetical protein HY675_19260 [Chloroflexi bacterium]|nr:hypothetical protein [Chloroflexota bacterium]
MSGTSAPGGATGTIDPATGGRVASGRVSLDFPAGVADGNKPLSINLNVRTTLPASPFRGLYLVFDVEATEPIPPNGRKETARKVESLRRPVTIEVDITGISSTRPLVLSVWDQRLGHWWRIPTHIDAARNVARAQTWHFSSFGLGDDTQSPTPPQTLESFQTSLFTGTASAGYTIDIPPGTNGVAPKITLTYSSQAVDDMNETWAQIAPDGNTNGDNAENAIQAHWLGLGWSLELGAIFRRADNSYRLMLEGSSYELVEVDGSDPNDRRYRTKDDQFWLIRRRQDSPGAHNSTGTWWLIRTKNGTEYRFGYTGNSEMWAGLNQGEYVAWAFLLDTIKDPHGNTVEIDYLEQTDTLDGRGYDQAYYPLEIRYTRNAGNGLNPQRKVKLNLVDRTDYVTRSGEYQYYYKKKLDSIDVLLNDALVRKYVFIYDTGKTPYWHKPNSEDQVQGQVKLLLTEVYQGDGTCPVGPVYGNLTTGNYLPPVKLAYYEGTNAYQDNTIGKLHLKTVTNYLLGGTITYNYQRYTPQNWSGLKHRYRVSKETKSGGAGTSDVVRDFSYTWAWRDSSSGEFRGHDDVIAVDTTGIQDASKFYTNAGANGKSQADCNFLRGRTYRESVLKNDEAFQAVQNYGSDMSAAGYGRGGWNYIPAKFSIGTSGELRIGLIQSTSYDLYDHAGYAYFAPSYTIITKVEFDYETNYDNAKVILAMDYTDHPDVWTKDAFGPSSGHAVVNVVGGAGWVAFGVFARGGFSYGQPTGEWFGRIYNLKVYYRSILRSTDKGWEYVASVGDAKHIQLRQVQEMFDWQLKRVRYAYETSYGNVTDFYEDGDPNVSGDERRKHYDYAVEPAVGVWIVDRLSQEIVLNKESGQEVEKARTRYYYDRDGGGNRRAHGSAPTLGDLIAIERVYLGDEAKNAWTDYWHDAFGNRTREQDGRGNQTNAVYESTYRTFPYTITNAKSQVETRSYDPATGRIASVVDINNQTTGYEYDSFKRLSKVRRPGDESPATPTLEVEYYCNTGQAAPRFAITTTRKDTSADGVYRAKSWHDGLGRVVQSRAENAAGSNPLVVDTGFDSRGLKSSQSVPYVAGSSTWDYTSPDGTQPKTQYAYEGLRRTSQVTNPDSTARLCYYSGRTTSQVDERSHRRDLTNDPFDRLVQVKEYTGSHPGTLYATTDYSYDGLNNLMRIADNAGNITKMQYNPLSQRTKLHDPDRAGSNDPLVASYWWYFEYDLAGNLTKVTDAKGQVIELGYDELNRLVRKYYAMDWVSQITAGVSKPSVYDIIELRSAVDVNRVAAGLSLYAWSDPAIVAGTGVKVRAVHFNELKSAIQELLNAAGIGNPPNEPKEFSQGPIVAGTRVIKASDPNDLRSWLADYEGSDYAQTRRARANYAYDEYDGVNQYGKGRRTAMYDVSGRRYYRYDRRGRVVRDEQIVDGQSYVTQYTYDSMDRVASMTYPDGEVLTYTYGDHSKLTAIASSLGVNYLQSATYNQLLKPKVLSFPSGVQTTLSYYGNGLDTPGLPYGSLQRIYTVKAGLPLIQDLQHTYDNTANLTRWQDLAAAEDFTYEYDDLDRLTKKKNTGGADLETFGYNQIGNITNKNGLGYTYESPLRVHGVISHNGVSYGYDDNGNMVSAGSWAYSYDKENRMVKAVLSGVLKARFAYDADGRRGKRVDDYGTIHYVGGHYERNVGNGQDTAEKVTKYYYAALGAASRLIALRKNGVLYCVHSDHLGGSTRMTDASGNIVDSIGYTCYGETRFGGSNLQTDRKYTGQILDLSTGLYWYASRPYSPALGRFTQPDTIVPDLKNPQALNAYGYVLNNPLKYVDPTGHDDEEEEGNAEAEEPAVGNLTSAFDLGVQWLLGLGPSEQVFYAGDEMTELLRTHSYIDEVRATMAARVAQEEYGSYYGRYDLSGLQGVPKYVGDYANVLTGGRTGNLAVTFLGSYDVEVTVLSVDKEGGTAQISLHVSNESNLASATHPPVLGYTEFWQQNIEPLVNSIPSYLPWVFDRAPVSETTQHFFWNEPIRFK